MTEQSERQHLLSSLPERGYLVGTRVKGSHHLLDTEDSLDELAALAITAGVDVVGRTHQNLERQNPATLIGSGKVEEIQEAVAELAVDVIIFDDELTPRHQRELENAFGEDLKVLDRTALILDIFANHAQTREGALQVELAQYEYRLPRLTRQWTHLARQTGGGAARAGGAGVGLRGPGETQLEVDRREIGRRISRLKKELEAVRAHRQRHRQQRQQSGVPLIAFVGYTNAGKSTLLNRIADADVYTADQLFATLDPTTRRVTTPGGKLFLCTDTVGFIQKLPTTLVAAFRATLEEIAEAALLLHVADASHPNLIQQIEAVEQVLSTLNLPVMPRMLALNKMDLLEGEPSQLSRLVDLGTYKAIVPISAKTGEGLDILLDEFEALFMESMSLVHLLIPYQRGDIGSLIHEHGIIIEEQHTETGLIIQAQLPTKLASQILAVEDIIRIFDKQSP